jgi:putative acetyltransferase
VIEIVDATTDSEYLSGKALIEEYALALGVDLCFQGFNEELASLRTLYGPPRGCLLLARANEEFAGLVALRAHKDTTCELKRLYVRGQYRGIGVGRSLAEAAVVRARELGYAAVVLDTLETMAEARRLYTSLGFAATDAYYLNPLAGVHYMRLGLVTSQKDAA